MHDLKLLLIFIAGNLIARLIIHVAKLAVERLRR